MTLPTVLPIAYLHHGLRGELRAGAYLAEGLLHALEIGFLMEVVGHQLGCHGLNHIHH